MHSKIISVVDVMQNGLIIGFSTKKDSISGTEVFVNRSLDAVEKVYCAWQNSTIENKRRGKCGGPREIEETVEQRQLRCLRANQRVTLKKLIPQMNHGVAASESKKERYSVSGTLANGC